MQSFTILNNIWDVIKKIPKLRGHGVNRARTINDGKKIVQAITLAAINNAYAAGETVSRVTLLEKGIADRKTAEVKIVATGELNKKLTFEGVKLTAGATEKVNSAGGSIK